MPAAIKRSVKKKTKKKASKSKGNSSAKAFAKISNAAVLKATGKGWNEWLTILDKFDVKANGHAAAAEFLSVKQKIGPWWSQMVVVGYEQARGLRKAHQTAKGFSASVSKTIAADFKRVWKHWQPGGARDRWLGSECQVKVGLTGKAMTLVWKDGTKVLIGFFDKTGKAGVPKTMVTVEQSGLRDEDHVQDVKTFWKGLLGKLEADLAKSAKRA